MALPEVLMVFAAISGVLPVASATSYTVGAPAGGWDLRTNLSSWASAITFKTGDKLIFSYNSFFHDVVEVSEANYNACSAPGAINTYNSGKDVIFLSSPEKRYFICGISDHCAAGMKVEIDTTASLLPSSSISPTIAPSSAPAASPSPH